MHDWLQRIWYDGTSGYRFLLPLSALYWTVIGIRRLLYRTGMLPSRKPAAPVVVVGNVTVGGTGKTPVAVWLVGELRRRGFRPGIVSRGYGGSRSPSSMRVDGASDPALVGDEPVLLAMRTGVPVVVDANRLRAADMLVDDGCDLVIADDGLQHYRLGRSYEICVVDGSRGLGNRHLLPAGPLRETVDRMKEVDQVLLNGQRRGDQGMLSVVEQNAIVFELVPGDAVRLDGSLVRPLARFSGTTVHAIAAIGNPARFFDMLRTFGIQVIEHPMADHAKLSAADLDFGDRFPVLMTEKDAVKLGRSGDDRLWKIPVDVEIDPARAMPWLAQMESLLRREQERR